MQKNNSQTSKFATRYLVPLLDRFGKCFPDKLYISLYYYLKFKKRINWKSPTSFTEKLQWLKLYNRNPEYTIMADKVKAKEWIAKRIGEQYIIPTIGVWEHTEDIDFNALPNSFVLKCNHNSGTGMYICKDKSQMNKKEVIKNLEKGLKENYYLHCREWPYKNIPRRILAEKFMIDSTEPNTNKGLTDYNFFCFNGEPFMMYISNDNAEFSHTDFFDMDYNQLPIRMKDPNSNNPPSKPKEFEQMKMLARKLSEGIPHLRVDFYVINNNIFVGELTFYHNAGFTPISPTEWDLKLGQLINLRKYCSKS